MYAHTKERYQVPHDTELVNQQLGIVQRRINDVASGGDTWMRYAYRTQPRKEGGLGQMIVARHLCARWHKLGLEVATSAAPRPWKNFYPYYVKQAYSHHQIRRARPKLSRFSFSAVVKRTRTLVPCLSV